MCDKCRGVSKPSFREYWKGYNIGFSELWDVPNSCRWECKHCGSIFEEEGKSIKTKYVIHEIIRYSFFIIVFPLLLFLFNDIFADSLRNMGLIERIVFEIISVIVEVGIPIVIVYSLLAFMWWIIYRFTRFRVAVDKEA